jgi:hypothetical protein
MGVLAGLNTSFLTYFSLELYHADGFDAQTLTNTQLKK